MPYENTEWGLTHSVEKGDQPVQCAKCQEPCNQGVPCAGDVDCQFDSWTQWSACTRTARGEVSLLCRGG